MTRALTLTLVLPAALTAQVEWTRDALGIGAMTQDPSGVGLLSLTDTGLWRAPGLGWLPMDQGSLLPQPTFGHTMTTWWGPGGGLAMVFGGLSVAGRTNRTLLWSGGGSWQSGPPAPAALEPRDSHAMAFDRLRRKVLLFGGFGASGSTLNDTWEWDPVNHWVQRTPIASPPPRLGHAMAFEPSRQRVLLFGGNNSFRSDTWEFDDAANTWRQLVASGNPTLGRKGAALADDGSQVLLCGGENASGLLNDTWLWDDNLAAWVQLNPAHRPAPRRGHALAYHPGPAVQSLVLAGGSDAAGVPLDDLWLWHTGDWLPAPRPPARQDAAMAAIPGTQTVLLHGGFDGTALLGDTWWLAQATWVPLSGQGPGARRGHAMAGIDPRQEVLLFGGEDATLLADTWLWRGTWRLMTPTLAPPARTGHGLAYDAQRNVVVLFGGRGAGNLLLDDTWEWNGTAWTAPTLTTRPPARAGFGMAYDAARHRVVVAGGHADTWEFDGATWQRRTPAATPPAGPASMVFDPLRQRCVLRSTSSHQDWEWDGTTWALRTPMPALPATAGLALSWDEERERVLAFGGMTGGLLTNVAWRYGTRFVARAVGFGPQCMGSAGTPTLRPEPGALPWAGDSLVLRLDQAPIASVSLLFVGVSRDLWLGLPLPLPLPGTPGCSLSVSLDLGPLPFLSATGIALPLPMLAPGTEFYLQAATVDPLVVGGLTTSNGLALRLGVR